MNWPQFTYFITFSVAVLLFAAFIRFGPGRHEFSSRAKRGKSSKRDADDPMVVHSARVLEAAFVRHASASPGKNIDIAKLAMRRIAFVSQKRERTANANALVFESDDASDARQIRAKLPVVKSLSLQ